MTASVFVYGTLKPGGVFWPALEPFTHPDMPPVEAEIDGQIWATPYGYPAVTPGNGIVRGVLVTLNPAYAGMAIARLDEIEGVDNGLYDRVTTVTRCGAQCYTYMWPRNTDGFTLLDGEWPTIDAWSSASR